MAQKPISPIGSGATGKSWFGKGMTYLGSVFGNNSGSANPSKNIGTTSMRIPLQRIVQSIQNWRDGVMEAEYFIPFRVKQQQLFNDLQDEPHVAACMERRMDLTLLRDYIIDCGNDAETDKWTSWLKEQNWFIDYQRYVLTAKFRGYSLISMGSIISNETMTNGLPELKMLEHSLISPDRHNMAPIVYAVHGTEWDDNKYKNWHIYVSTPPEFGNAACGYGLLHKIAVPAILLRNNLTDNANYNEKFGQPVVWGKTNKVDNKDSSERTDFFNSLKNMGASGTFVTDLEDVLEFLEAKGAGQAYKTFADLEMRCQKLISKNILGHADVLDSIPKRSGSSSGASNPSTPSTPVQDALSDISSKDGKYVTPYVNQLLFKMRLHGVGIPQNAVFRYKNDEEEELAKQKEYEAVLAYATIAYEMKQGGLQMSPEDFTKETGVNCEAVAISIPTKPVINNPLPTEVKNRLDILYKHKHK